jgi:outer membrane biogenesis lipoprotein LolB
MIRVTLLAAALLLLVACAAEDKPAAQTPPPRQPTVIDPQLQALQRAKDVQNTVDAHKAETDAKLREAEGQ